MSNTEPVIVPHVKIEWEVIVKRNDEGPSFNNLSEALTFRDDVIAYGYEAAMDALGNRRAVRAGSA